MLQAVAKKKAADAKLLRAGGAAGYEAAEHGGNAGSDTDNLVTPLIHQ
jgi:hypothetical protein